MYQMVADRLVKVFSSGIGGRKVNVLNELSFQVEEGEVFGLLGPNGAGKTTAIKIFMGLLHPTSGRAEVLGKPSWDVSVKGRIGFLPEGPYFYDYLTGEEFLDFCGCLFDLNAPLRRERIGQLLNLVGLSEFGRMKLRRYSKGMLQRIGLAQALINDPALLVLDEPMSGLDPMGRKELTDIILRLKKEGKTIFFSSHILSDVERICDRVAIIDMGRLVYMGKVKELMGGEPRYFRVALEGASDRLIKEAGGRALEVMRVEGGAIFHLDKQEDVDWLLGLARQNMVRVRAVVPVHPSLEERFVGIIRGKGAQ